MERSQRFDLYNNSAVFNFSITYEDDVVGADGVTRQFEDVKYFTVGFAFKLWESWRVLYDGMSCTGFTLLGIRVSWGRSWQCDPN